MIFVGFINIFYPYRGVSVYLLARNITVDSYRFEPQIPAHIFLVRLKEDLIT